MVIRDQRINLRIDTEELEEKLNQVTEWQDWYEVEKTLFKIGEWQDADIETMEAQSQRERIVINGHEWIPLADPCGVNREIRYLHEMARLYAFEKLEPEAYAENLSRKEDYGKECSFCLRYTRDFDVDNCPFCGRKLALWYLRNY